MSNDRLSPAVKPRSIPDSLLPQSVEGFGYTLADAALRLTRSPAVVVVRDPAMQTASVVAASIGTDRRLLGMTVAPTSAAGRVCIADVTAYATGAQELLGKIQANRRRREEQGVAFSLRDGRRSVGALVAFPTKTNVCCVHRNADAVSHFDRTARCRIRQEEREFSSLDPS